MDRAQMDPRPAAALFEVESVSLRYGRTPVLDDVSFSTRPDEVLGLVGPNGSGKTTLLRLLHGALRPDAGSVRFAGREVAAVPRREMARNVAVVVQEPPGDLELSVAETVLMGRLPHRRLFDRGAAADEALAVEALDRVGALHLADRGLTELSGGERQRVLMARALVQQARCLLLDEPTNHLDVGFAHQLLALVRDLGLPTIVVLHDLNLAARYCDRIVLLANGRVLAHGAPAAVLTPERVSAVYGVGAEFVIAGDGTGQLLFDSARVAPADTTV